MKLATMLFVILGFAGSFSQADETNKMVCHFTEPFYSIRLDKDAKVNSILVLTSESVHSVGQVLVSKTYGDQLSVYSNLSDLGAIRLVVDKAVEGSDGMSDKVYPFTGNLSIGPDSDVEGGCEYSN